jgi:DNA-binding MarR family transcriptional regulator
MPASQKSKAELALDLGRVMAELRTLLRQRIQVKIKENGVNMTFEMLEVLSCLWRKDGINQQEIADYTLRDKSSMTYLLDNLVKRKLVYLVEDENDRRNKLIFVTPEGLALREQMYPWAMEVYELAANELNGSDLEKATSVLSRMTATLKKT